MAEISLPIESRIRGINPDRGDDPIRQAALGGMLTAKVRDMVFNLLPQESEDTPESAVIRMCIGIWENASPKEQGVKGGRLTTETRLRQLAEYLEKIPVVTPLVHNYVTEVCNLVERAVSTERIDSGLLRAIHHVRMHEIRWLAAKLDQDEVEHDNKEVKNDLAGILRYLRSYDDVAGEDLSAYLTGREQHSVILAAAEDIQKALSKIPKEIKSDQDIEWTIRGIEKEMSILIFASMIHQVIHEDNKDNPEQKRIHVSSLYQGFLDDMSKVIYLPSSSLKRIEALHGYVYAYLTHVTPVQGADLSQEEKERQEREVSALRAARVAASAPVQERWMSLNNATATRRALENCRNEDTVRRFCAEYRNVLITTFPTWSENERQVFLMRTMRAKAKELKFTDQQFEIWRNEFHKETYRAALESIIHGEDSYDATLDKKGQQPLLPELTFDNPRNPNIPALYSREEAIRLKGPYRQQPES